LLNFSERATELALVATVSLEQMRNPNDLNYFVTDQHRSTDKIKILNISTTNGNVFGFSTEFHI